MPSKQRNFEFTYFNESLKTDDWDSASLGAASMVRDIPSLRYIAFQLERAPTSGRLHVQGCFYTQHPISWGRARQLLPLNGYHISTSTRTIHEAIKYCSKTETKVGIFISAGDCPSGGLLSGPSGLQQSISLLQEGASMREVAKQHPGSIVRYSRGLRELLALIRPPPTRENIRVLVLFGPTGTGKSKFCQAIAPPGIGYWWPKSQNGCSYCMGYAGESTCVLDDFFGDLPYHLLLRLLDRYPMSVNLQGSNMPWMADRIIISTNHHPDDWYKYQEKGLCKEALFDRFTRYGKLVYVTADTNWTSVKDWFLNEIREGVLDGLPRSG